MNYRAIARKTLLGFVVGTALSGFMVGAAFVAFVAVATTADAYMPGGGPNGLSSSIGIHNSASRSLIDSQRNNWNKPLEFGSGDPDGPAAKTTGKGPGGGINPTPRRSGSSRNPR